jgi:thioredoxin reductase
MYDVIIIGGSFAGLAAALQLARARRRVLILDAGQRRNRFAGHSHGFLGQDGQPPEAIAARGRADVLAYPTVTWQEGLATEAARIDGGFLVRASGEEFRARRLIIATGVIDELPAIPGLGERWGKTVFSCPYCDGYEFKLAPLGVLASSPPSGPERSDATRPPPQPSLAARFAVLVSEWAAPGRTTLFGNGAFEPTAEDLAQLDARRITLERQPVVEVGGGPDSIDLRLGDGRTTTVAGIFLHTRTRFSAPFAEQLGCELEMSHLGPYYKTDASKQTTVPGVFACGDVAQPMAAISHAISDGVRAGAFAHQSLVFPSLPHAH